MRRLKCVDCLLWFMESDIRGDAFLCPQCGGRLEELTEDTGSRRSAGHEGASAESKQQGRPDKIRTHYDNLKVARDAPDEVIRAAYRSLSQKYHPDKNQSPDAVRVMRIINAAYETLSDPQKRHGHDLWIAREEERWKKAQDEGFSASSNHQEAPAGTSRSQSGVTFTIPKPNFSVIAAKIKGGKRRVFGHFKSTWGWYLAALLLLFLGSQNNHRSAPVPGPKPYQTEPPPSVVSANTQADSSTPLYNRPNAAPNGQPWPSAAAYVPGYKRHHTSGYSIVKVDNSGNSSDVFVKLVSVGGDKAYPVRCFFIPGHSEFTVKKVSPGSYDIRYRDLDNGQLFRSEPFNLEENRTETGVEYSRMRMTLYKVPGGNMKSYDLPEDEF